MKSFVFKYYLKKFGAHRKHKLVCLKEGSAGGNDHIGQERAMAELLRVGEEN